VEQELKDLVEQLGTAIDETIAESGRIGEIVQEMERAGYDVTLVLEATMRFTPKEQTEGQEACELHFDSSQAGLVPTGRFDLTPQDEEFLQSLKVSM
jgi:hypothetical protein